MLYSKRAKGQWTVKNRRGKKKNKASPVPADNRGGKTAERIRRFFLWTAPTARLLDSRGAKEEDVMNSPGAGTGKRAELVLTSPAAEEK